MEIDGTLVVGLLVAKCKNFDSANRYFKWSGKASLEQQAFEELIIQMVPELVDWLVGWLVGWRLPCQR